MLRRMKKGTALLMIIMMAVTVFGTAAASAEVSVPASDTNPYIFVHDSATPYWHRSPHRINSGTTPAIYHLVSGGESLPAYCCDIETSISPGTAYKRINLEDAGYYTADSAAHIRFILTNGFWADRNNLAELGAAAGVEGLTAAEALTATQAAIWSYANVASISDVYWGTSAVSTSGIKDTSSVNPAEGAADSSDARINAVYNYLRSGTLANASVVAGFTGEKVVLTVLNDLNSYDVSVKFGLEGTFRDAGSLKLNAQLSNSAGTIASAEYDLLGAGALSADADGLYTVTFKGVDGAVLEGAEITLKLNGVQNVQNGIYFYEPEGGRSSAQCFVGYGAGETPVFGETSVNVEVGELEVSLKKVDASVLTDGAPTPMEGVKFDLYVQIEGKTAVKYPGLETAETDAEGFITWSGLAAADNVSYFYKESVPAGYHADEAEGALVPGEAVLVQNCHDLGDLTIAKATPNMEADSVNAGRHFNFLVTLDYSRAQLLQNSHEWPTVEVLEKEYAVLEAVYKDCCDGAEHPVQAELKNEGNGIMSTVISLAGGEAITLKGIPAGAAYTVTELDAEGNLAEAGKLYDFAGELIAPDAAVKSGIIPAGHDTLTSVAFSNYVYDETEWDIDEKFSVTKNLDGQLSGRAFRFVLTDVTDPAARKIVETVSNGVEGDDKGRIDFSAITYTEAGTYTYEIHEELTYGYICDDKVYAAVVKVVQNDRLKRLEIESADIYLPEEVSETDAAPEIQQFVVTQTVDFSGSEEQVLDSTIIPEVKLVPQNEIVFNNETIHYDTYTGLAVKKVWKLDDGGTAAEAVTVNLLKNGEIAETVTLSAANSWSKTWFLLDDSYQWSVEEADVPEGFTASISRSGLTWTIVNDDIGSDDKEDKKEEKPDKDDGNGGGNSSGGDGSGEGGNSGGAGDDEELILLEEDVPLADVPKTSGSLTAEILCIVSGLVLVILLTARKKKAN